MGWEFVRKGPLKIGSIGSIAAKKFDNCLNEM